MANGLFKNNRWERMIVRATQTLLAVLLILLQLNHVCHIHDGVWVENNCLTDQLA